ncbi:MAG TPA: DJ-1/PfpI family protein [Methylomirabilota bacterium]|jgi:transcriptional regulator GlxA family with amidase domain|nr:DJ-1/PfpI family protein [Methylomirabilota bacterium]
MDIAILAFDGMTALDAVGPAQVLALLPGAAVRWVSPEPGPRRTDAGMSIVADQRLADVEHPDVVLVPGGLDMRPVMADARVLDWLRAAHATTRWTTSVCTGALVLGAAGLLRGRRATTHWAVLDRLGKFGATPVGERVVIDGKVITAAGVSAGIDMALRLAERLADAITAQGIQLGIEYDPQPPFAGSPKTAPAAVVEAALRALARAGG